MRLVFAFRHFLLPPPVGALEEKTKPSRPRGEGLRGEREAVRVGRGCLVGLPARERAFLLGRKAEPRPAAGAVPHQGRYPLWEGWKGPFPTSVGTRSRRVGRGIFPETRQLLLLLPHLLFFLGNLPSFGPGVYISRPLAQAFTIQAPNGRH